MNKRSLKYIALFVTTLIIVLCIHGTLVFASDSDAYSYSNDLLRSWASQISFTGEHVVVYKNGSYFIDDIQSGYFTPESSFSNNTIWFTNVPQDADRFRICFYQEITPAQSADKLIRLDFHGAVIPNVYDIRIFADNNVSCNVEFWYYTDDDHHPVVYFTIPSASIYSEYLNVDFYVSAVRTDNSAEAYFPHYVGNVDPQGCRYSFYDLRSHDISMELEIIHAINNLAHVMYFTADQFSDISYESNFEQLQNIYTRMASIISNTYNDPGIVGYSAGSSYSSILDRNIVNYTSSDQSINKLSGTRFVFDICPVAKNDIVSFRITFTSEAEKLLYRTLLGTYNWDFSGSFTYQSLGIKYDNDLELITFTESRNNITFVIYNPDHYSHLRIRFRTEQSMTTDNIRVSYILNTNDYYMQYMILRAINGLDFSYPESAGDQTINNINIQFDNDYQTFNDIEFGYQQDLDNAFDSVSVDSYKLSTGFKDDISFVSDLMQHMFLMTLSPEYDDDDSFNGYGSSLGVVIVISLVLIVLLAIFRRTRS